MYVNYTIEMQFGVFGMEEIPVTKAAKSKTFGDILFGISVVPEDSIKGSASGSGNYKHGSKVQISATPNYGYKFKQWDDGNTENPRTVTVTGAATYPEGIIEELQQDNKVFTVNAMEEAKKLGNSKVFNIIVLGIAAKHMDYTKDQWLTVIENTVPPKTVEINKKAFEIGYEM